MGLLKTFGVSFALTLAIELAVALACGVRNRRDLLLVALANLVTNPMAVYIYILICLFAPVWRTVGLAALEVAAFAAEGLIYRRYIRFHRINPWLLSLLLNAASFSAGQIFKALF